MTHSHLAPIPELFVSPEAAAKLKIEAGDMPSWDLTARQACDLELLMNGGFNPLKGFNTEADYNNVVENMRLADGTLWPIPITLDVSEKFAEAVAKGGKIALRDAEGVILAVMTVTDKWTPNKKLEAEKVFGYGADDLAHPAINYLHNVAGPVYLGGPIQGLQAPIHYDFKARRDTPNELRAYFRKLGWDKIVAFQTRNPLHRAHQELTFRAAKEAQANLLIHPVVAARVDVEQLEAEEHRCARHCADHLRQHARAPRSDHAEQSGHDQQRDACRRKRQRREHDQRRKPQRRREHRHPEQRRTQHSGVER